MVLGGDTEYGVYERLAVLETEVAALKAARFDGSKSTQYQSLFTISRDNLVIWFLIGSAALGNGPEVLEVLKQVLLK